MEILQEHKFKKKNLTSPIVMYRYKKIKESIPIH